MRKSLMVGAVVAATCGLAATPALAVTVTNVEVTQATQTTTNGVKLIARRSTAVRATLATGGGAVAGVDGRLHVIRSGVDATPTGIAPINAPYTAPAAPQRASENDTLNFELTGAMATTLLSPSADVVFRVDVTPGPSSLSTASLNLVDAATPSVFFTRINYTPGGLPLPPLSFVGPGSGDAFLRGIAPVNDNDPNFYRQGLFPSLTFAEDQNGNNKLDACDPATCSTTPAEGADLLSLLGACRQLIVNNGLGAEATTYLYGWVPGAVTGNGLSTIPGVVAFGNSELNRGQRSFAHEFTHLLGQVHNTRTLDQVGWDVGSRLPGNPATNNVAGRVKPMTLNDIQTPALLTNQAWVDTLTYGAELVNPGIGLGPDASPDQVKRRLRSRQLVVQGVFDPSGKRLLSLKPVFRYPWTSEATLPDRRGAFMVRVRTASGATVSVPFDARVGNDAGEERRGFFEVMVPVGGQVSSIAITNRQGSRAFGRLSRAKVPPVLRILSPRRGATLAPKTTVTWTVKTGSIPASKLRFQAAYSPDGGRTFVPIGVDLRKPRLTFDSRAIRKSAGRGLIRVFVSDGLNSSFADVTGLSAPAGVS
jgi:hypothetical protein